jgi:hypothetical protein
MKITVIHPITGKPNTLDLPCTIEQYTAWRDGAKIQDAMPNLTPDQREFLIFGLLPGEFDEMFEEEEDDFLLDLGDEPF